MKKSIYAIAIAASLLLSGVKAAGQNLQLHYDFGRDCATSTFEMFRPDKGGSTYCFIDLNYSPRIHGAYIEASREFNFWQDSKVDWLSIHVEYNGGMTMADKANPVSFNNAVLGGLTYSFHNKDFSKTFSVTASYKAIFGNEQVHNFQITGVWNLNFFKNWLSFNGFIDVWREKNPLFSSTYTIVSQPQLWLNLDKIPGWEDAHLSIGTEVELSHNFYQKGFACCPTAGLKYTF